MRYFATLSNADWSILKNLRHQRRISDDLLQKFMERHYWYIQMVVRSKMFELDGVFKPDEVLASEIRWIRSEISLGQPESLVSTKYGVLIMWKMPSVRFDTNELKTTWKINYQIAST